MMSSPKELEQALIDGTCHIFQSESDATAVTVNKIRRHVEEDLSLEDGFFATHDWKHKSRAIIKEYVDKLASGWLPDSLEIDGEASPRLSSGKKRQSSETTSPDAKRAKRATQSKKPPQSQKSKANKPQKAKVVKAKAKPRRKSPSPDIDGQSATSSSLSSLGDEDESKDESEERAVKLDESIKDQSRLEKESKDEEHKQDTKASATVSAINEEEEYSDVLDEPPLPKRKKKEKADPRAKKAKSVPKKASSSAPKVDDSNEGEIKKLQSHLVKCGIRKLWHNELKKYGDDTRAKIRHLKKMLADIGMDGRFSEARAREIKESRELMAEAEAAQEMNRLWGMGGRSRANRSKSKSTKLENGSEDEGEADGTDGNVQARDDSDESDQDNSFAARSRRARADLAFLGDDSDSD
ncbi:hypothetical protein CDD81_6597 [Ophiocordyceps australis]|uniref:Transcriptional regulator n=1 Tax=Ophiocordyceps australis TaxID=1399860 RepID=A0A2C5X9E4_9HYPO|nr:hypothetical protein CDD81_6597 [Ophiocordyceps australis]